MFGGDNSGGGNGGGNDGGMFSLRAFCSKATKIPVANSPYNYLGKIAFSFGVAAISAGYTALTTKEGQEFASRYINSFLGDSSKIDASDFDGS